MSAAEPATRRERAERPPARRPRLARARRALRRRARPAAGRLQDRPAVRLQRGREQPLRPARDRDVRARPEPGLLHQPAGVHVRLHALFALRWGTDPAIGRRRVRGRPDEAFAIARAASGVPRRARRPADRDRRRAAVRGQARRVHSPARCSRSRSCPSTTATSRSTTRRRWRRSRSRWSASPGSTAPAARASTCSPGVGLGVAIATKYTAGIVLVTLSRRRSPRRSSHARVRNLAFAFALMRAGVPGRQPVRAARPPGVPRRPARSRPRPRARTAASSAWRNTHGLALLPADVHLGLRLAAVAARARRARRADRAPPAARARCSRPRRSCCSSTSASSRASSRAGCCRSTRSCAMLGGVGDRRAGRAAARPRVAARRARRALALLRQGLVFSVHNDLVLARDDTRQVARDWMVAATSRSGTKIVDRADRARPVGDGRRPSAVRRPPAGPAPATAGTSGARRARASSTAGRSRPAVPGGQARGLRAHDCARELVESYERRRVLLGRDRLDAVRPRVRGPGGGAGRAALLRRAAQARAARSFPRQPVRRARARAVLVRLLVQLLPADLRAARARRSSSTGSAEPARLRSDEARRSPSPPGSSSSRSACRT